MGDLEDFLEKWPAHALGRVFAKSNACVINNKLVSLTEVETSWCLFTYLIVVIWKEIPNIVPKPKFLDTLEKKICSGLKNIQSDDRDLRFQVSFLYSCIHLFDWQIYKEAFQSFIHEFKTYRTFLSVINKEYEEYLNFYKAEAQKLRPVKVKLIICLLLSFVTAHRNTSGQSLKSAMNVYWKYKSEKGRVTVYFLV